MSKVGQNPAIIQESKAKYQSYHLEQEKLMKMIADANVETEPHSPNHMIIEEKEDRDTMTLCGDGEYQ